MAIQQIIILTILSLIMIICFLGTALAKSNIKRFGFIMLWFFVSSFTMIIAMIMTEEREKLLKKCPQYEKYTHITNR